MEGTCTAESTRIGDTIYLLYDVYYGERFNFRKSLIKRVGSTLGILEKYTDYKWVLVLPPFRGSEGGGVEFSEWSEFFDMNRLKGHKENIMEWDKYMQQAGDVIDVVIRKEDKETCGQKMEKYGVRKSGEKWDLMGRKVTIKEFMCAPGKGQFKQLSASSRGLLDMVIEAVEGGATSVMIDDFREISPAHKRAPYWEWRQHLYFAEELQSEATRFLAPFEKEGYIAMHMRRTDFVTGHKKTYSNTEEVATLLQKLASDAGLKHVFVATDSKDDELDKITNSLDAHGITLHRYKPGHYGEPKIDYNNPTGNLKLALVEQILCSRAKAFVGTKSSHFSKEINLERKMQQGGGEEFYENSHSLIQGGELIPLCKTWHDGVTCEINVID
jgi:peptide-O-fucosyltransferase